MKVLKVACIVLLFNPSSVHGQEDVTKKIQSILQLPRISLSPGFAFRFTLLGAEPVFGPEVFSPSTLRSEREALERKLSGAVEKDAPIYRQIGEISERLGDREKANWAWEQAAKCYRALVEKEPKNWRWRLHLIEAIDKTGKSSEAEAELKKTIELCPKSWEVQLAAGSWEFSRPYKKPFEGLQPLLDAMKAAMKYWQKASQLAPKEPAPYLFMSLGYLSAVSIVSAENPEEAKKWLTMAKDMAWQAAEYAEDDPFLLSWAIMLEFREPRKEKQQQVQESQRKLMQIAESGKNPSAWGLAGIVNFLEGKFEEAKDYFEKARRFEPDRWTWHEALIGIAVMQERWHDALKIAEDWLSRHELPRARFMAAKVAEKLGDWEKVESHLKAALEEDENDFYANLGMVVVELRRGEPKEAVNRAMPYWQRVSKLTPPNKEAHLSSRAVYGVMLTLVGRRKEAIETFKQILQEEPENQTAKDALSILSETN